MSIPVPNAANVARSGERVTLGFPVAAASGITDPNAFRVTDPSGAPVAAQFRALTRWGGPRQDSSRPLRWVQASFSANVPTNGTATYTIHQGGGGPSGALSVATTTASFAITTMPGTTFTLSRTAFEAMSLATVNGQNVLSSPATLDMAAPGGAPIQPIATSTVLEESGSVRAVVCQRGTLNELRYTCRWTFHAGSSEVELQFRLENPLAYGLLDPGIPDGTRYFDRVFIRVPVPGALTITSASGSRALAAGHSYEQKQTFAWTANNEDALAGFQLSETDNGAVLATGGRGHGAIDVTGSTGVTVAVDRYWQNFPKGFRVQNGELQVALWPDWGSGPHYTGQGMTPTMGTPDPNAVSNYRYEGGRWKTHRAVFSFHGATAATPAQLDALAQRTAAPLVGTASGRVVGTTNATGLLFIDRRPSYPTAGYTRYEQFHDMVARDSAADDQLYYGRVGLPGFKAKGGTNGGMLAYGWENWGDIPWTDGYSNLHYDWAGSTLLAFIRSGDYGLFDQGRDMAAFLRDYGMNHSTNTAEYWRGCAFYEKGFWHGDAFPGAHSHNWLLGMMLYYVITGDEGVYEAINQNLDYILRDPPGQWSGYWGSRIPGWQINDLVNAHNLLGTPGALAAAGAGVARYEQLEVAEGMHGYHLDPGNNPPSTSPWLDNIFFMAAAHYVIASGDTSHHAFLYRMKTWFKNSTLILPTGTFTALNMPGTYRDWSPAGGSHPSFHLCWPTMECLSYSALLFNDIDDLAKSITLFELLTHYWQGSGVAGPTNLFDPAQYSKITMRPGGFPGTESKIVGNILMWGRAHEVIRAYMQGWL